MQIEWVGMTRRHYQPGTPDRIRCVVLHATAGRAPSDLAWLRKGGDERRPVSVHYYIDKAGRIRQLVADADIAWHAGRSRWPIDGTMRENLNTVSLGIELENLNTGRDPYPEAQYAAALDLTRTLVRRYKVPRAQLVRHLDIAPGRKTDPAGFPWQRFVAEVYADLPDVVDTPAAQLRAMMLDLAYRSAGSALPAGWPLLEVARAQGLGMPVAALSGRRPRRTAGSAQDDHDRAVRPAGGSDAADQPLIAEVYARDLLYAPITGDGDEPPTPAEARRLADTPAGPLRDGLLELMFRTADPLHGFQPGWAFHQHYLDHSAELGTPIGPSHRIALGPGQVYVCQHFALDSLCSPVGAWQSIYRLGALAREVPGLEVPVAAALRRALLDDLYRARVGRRYNQSALLTAHAEARRLGAPLGPPVVVTVEGMPYLLMPFALDVLACLLPRLDWPLDKPLPEATPVFGLEEVGSALLNADPRGTLSDERLAAWDEPNTMRPGSSELRGLLGAPMAQPALFDLRPAAPGLRRGKGLPPDTLLIVAAPDGLRLLDEQVSWHYFLDTSGAIYRLGNEAAPALVIAIEGGPAPDGLAQRAALTWLVRTLVTALHIPPERVRATRTPEYSR